MRILIALLVLCSIDVFGQYRSKGYYIDTQQPKETRIDTIFGAIVLLANGDEVKAVGGFRRDSVEVWKVSIECPDKEHQYSCSVSHYGDRDFIKSSTYWTIDKSNKPEDVRNWIIMNIPEKYIIKFIE